MAVKKKKRGHREKHCYSLWFDKTPDWLQKALYRS